MTKQLRKQIEKTINVLETKGWCQGLTSKRIGDHIHHCVLGAFYKANPRSSFNDLKNAFINKFKVDPVAFNDKPHQKKSRVIGALRKLIQD